MLFARSGINLLLRIAFVKQVKEAGKDRKYQQAGFGSAESGGGVGSAVAVLDNPGREKLEFSDSRSCSKTDSIKWGWTAEDFHRARVSF